MSYSAGDSPGFVHNTDHQFWPQASTSPTAAYPPNITATGGSFYGHYPPAAPDDRSHYYQLHHQNQHQRHFTSTTTSVFHPGTTTAGSAEEREQKRRKSHSAMERKRRERTNDKIDEIKGLIPWLRDEARLQKLEILEHCVEYIRELQDRVRHLPATSNNKRRRLESRSFSMDSTGADYEEDVGEHTSDDHNNYVHRVSPPSLGSRRRRSGSNNSTRRHLQEDSAAVTHTHAGSPTYPHGHPNVPAPSLVALAAAATASELPLLSFAPNSRPLTLADVPAEYWNVDSVPSGDTPGLISAGSIASSKASSTCSAIAPSRSPLSPVDTSETSGTTLPLVGGLPQVKNSIDFLTS
ncbi:Sterol regulatory element-binding protein 2 [Coemansia aciculifera]|uniref:Sterol regulatory element-binding protein 2 n=1 Tax=Coemansia aciculifera TaxID=417176 RepID=A0A9W8IQC9_9FUNG|nr:Sterol regulatory element-binding protein 2 [Coemansia aciculifera]KAJ2873501.1 Sterol regulatory element-binding protein 2 [Coemansia aciculifera]